MKERLLKYARYARLGAYPCFYLVCLAIFASLTFPYDKLRQRIVASFNAQQRAGAGQQELQIDDLGGYWLSGVRVKGVRLFTAPSDPGQAPQKIEIDEATVRYGVLSALFGGADVNFDVHAFGGELTGSYEASGKDRSIDAKIDDVDIGRVDPLVQALGVPLQGKLRGSIRLALGGERAEGRSGKGGGAVSLEAADVIVGDGKAKIKGALALPPIAVGTVAISGEAKDGVLKLTKLVAGGKDVELQGDGHIVLRDTLADALCDVQLRFKINDAYRAKNDVTKSLFGAPGSNAPALFELADPRIKQSKRADGFYAWIVRGTLGRPDLVPAPGGGMSGAP